MKILVFSDSHRSRAGMYDAILAHKPDQIIHLGDLVEDAEELSYVYPKLPVCMVPGNCDRYRCPPWVQPRLCYDVCGVRLFMTHGHKHGVKTNTAMLVAEARAMHAQAALYGHTHIQRCEIQNGILLLNPGAAMDGHGALLEIDRHGAVSAAMY